VPEETATMIENIQQHDTTQIVDRMDQKQNFLFTELARFTKFEGTFHFLLSYSVLNTVDLILKDALNVKLDPETAHQCLVLSPDGKEVRDGGENHEVADSPKRFDVLGSVLGLNSLTTGKAYWEVEVNNKTGWDLGVARGSANRRGQLLMSPDNGYWVLVHYEAENYAAMTAPPTRVSFEGKPNKVGVFVDYEEGLLSFYDVTAKSHIYSFTECLFKDELHPYFMKNLWANEGI
uniref:B30.2/SPRY domain-containing protein n=1 Tax=Poecilia reticulata TaxID=8081 RepID=A0A3P9Q9T1_POERE